MVKLLVGVNLTREVKSTNVTQMGKVLEAGYMTEGEHQSNATVDKKKKFYETFGFCPFVSCSLLHVLYVRIIKR